MDACVSFLTNILSKEINFSIVGESSVELSKDLTAWSNRRKIKISLFPCVLSTDISKHILVCLPFIGLHDR